MKSRQAPTPRPTDDIQAMSFGGKSEDSLVLPPREQDVPFVSHAAQVRADSGAAEAAREKAAREFFDRQNAAPRSRPRSRSRSSPG